MRNSNIYKLIMVCLIVVCFVVNPSGKTYASTTSSDWVVFEGYSIVGDSLIAGEEGVISVNIRNTNSAKRFYNILLTFEDKSSEITPQKGGSNQIFIESIGAGEQCVVDFPVSVVEGSIGEKTVNVTMAYNEIVEDNKVTHANSTSFIIEVRKSSLIINDIQLNAANNELLVDYTNILDKDLNEAFIKVSGSVASSVNKYIGTIKAGESGNTKIELSFSSTGYQSVSVSTTYIDNKGNTVQSENESKLIFVENLNADQTSSGGSDYIALTDTSGNLKLILISCACVIIAVLVIRWMQAVSEKGKKNRRRKDNKAN